MSGDPRLRVGVVKVARAPLAPAWLRGVLAAAAGVPEVAARLPPDAELTLRLTGDRELRRLNRQFLGEDHATDVLSFPSGEEPYLGDVAIAWPTARRQALEHGHPAATEVALLAVHGLLHLLGWDHATPAEELEMTRLTLAGLAREGLAPAVGRL